MKTLYLLGALLLIAAGITLFTGCESITGGEPTSFTIAAASDTTVKLTWAVPAEGTPDKYEVYFKALSAASFTNVTELGNTVFTYTHDPSGSTGKYYVAAKFGSTEYKTDELSTIPVTGSAVDVYELNAVGNSGYGWGRTDGAKGTYSMTVASSAASVDFYLTNFALGFGGTPYKIASPDEAPSDSGNAGVPAGSWRINGISDPITDPQAPLPKYISGTTYFNFTNVVTYPSYLAVRMPTGSDIYYALIKVSGLNTTTGTVQVESWFQLIKGLRLIKH